MGITNVPTLASSKWRTPTIMPKNIRERNNIEPQSGSTEITGDAKEVIVVTKDLFYKFVMKE